MSAGVEIRRWGVLADGRPVQVAILRNARGFEARVSELGATLVGIRAPDRHGDLDEVVLGFETLADYVSDVYVRARPCFGATIGRFANRIAGARFTLDGQDHVLVANEGTTQLHGGPSGFDQAVWTMEPLADETGVRLSLTSPGGDQGFPGRLDVVVEMVVADETDTLVLRYRAQSDRPTHLNLTNHAYFNLNRMRAETIRGHDLRVFADAFTPTDEAFIPDGVIVSVSGLPLDLRAGRRLADVLDHPELATARGLNHNYVLRGGVTATPRPAARLSEATSGRSVEVWTTEPGLQVYSGSFLPTLTGRAGEQFGREAGIALETQHFPDSPNQPRFPSTRLDPGRIFASETQFRFSTTSEAVLEAKP